MFGEEFEMHPDYYKGWQSEAMGFVLVIAAFICLEPIVTSLISSKITPFLLECNKVGLWSVLLFSYIWLTYKSLKGLDENRFVSLRSLFLFVLPLYCIFSYYGIIRDVFPSFTFPNGIRISLVVVLIIPMGLYLSSTLFCCVKLRGSTSNLKRYKYTHDLAIKEKREDRFGYVPYVETLAKGVLSTNVALHSYSLAITGEWGSGKTSFMNMLSGELRDDTGANIMWFNPRQSRSWENIQEDFMMQLYCVIKQFSQTLSIGNAVLRYIGELNIDSSWGFVKTLINDVDRMLHENGRKEIERILRHRAKPLYIFIDDLDRLTALEMMEVFKLINKNAAFPYFYFITALDKARVNYMLSKYLGLEKVENYSDKYFNGEYHLPEKDYFKVVGNMNKLLTEKARAYHLKIAEKTISKHWHAVQKKTVTCLLTPRDLIRFGNEFMAAYSQVVNDVCFEDLWFLMLIKYKDQQTYEDIVSRTCLVSLKEKDVVYYGLDIKYSLNVRPQIHGGAVHELLKTLFPEIDPEITKEKPAKTLAWTKEFLNSPSYRRLYIRKHTNTYLTMNAGNDCIHSDLEKFLSMTDQGSELWLEKLCKRHKYIVYSYLTYIIEEGHMHNAEQKRIFVLLMLMYGKSGDYFMLGAYLRKYLTKDKEFVRNNDTGGDPNLEYVKRCIAYLLKRGDVRSNIIDLLLTICTSRDYESRLSVRDTLNIIHDNTDVDTLGASNMSSYVTLASVKTLDFAKAIMSEQEKTSNLVFNHLVPMKKLCLPEYGFDTDVFIKKVKSENPQLAKEIQEDEVLKELFY